MKRPIDPVKALGNITVGAAAFMTVAPAFAQPALDRVITGAEAENGEGCAVLQVNFNFPVQYISHFPAQGGQEVRIRVRAIDEEANRDAGTRRESTRPVQTSVTQVSAIEFDGEGRGGPTLNLEFAVPTNFQVGQGADFRSIRVALSGRADDSDCTPSSHPQARPASAAPAEGAPPSQDQSVGAGDPLLAEARAAMTAGDNAHAVQLLTRLLQAPENPSSRNAQELLGLARERSGQNAHARAEYEEYLRRYPSGPDAERVRQRLAGLLAGELPATREMRAASREREVGADEWRWDAGASFSQLYFRDDAVHTYEELFSSPTAPTTERTNHQNELLTALDVDVAVATNGARARFRASGAYVNDFRDEGEDEGSLSTAFLELADAEDKVSARVGRQTRSSAGILGRFDGVLASASPFDNIRFDLAAGYPVESSRDLTFDPDRYFYGASVDFQVDGWDASVYGLRQTNDGLIDREAVGLEARFVSDRINAFALFDYDLHFKDVNIALLNASFALVGDTMVNFGYDHRKAPLLTTTNAIIGQGVDDLKDIRALYTDEEIEQLARDRTAESDTYYIGIAHPFDDHFSLNVDATVSEYGATPDSGGVPATEGTGAEYYGSIQLVGSDLFTEGDLGIIGVRYADTVTSKRYGFDLNTRYPITRTIRINPRIRTSYRENKNDEGTQWSARPSLRLNVQTGRNFSFEMEAGAEWQRSETSMMRDESWDYFVTVGYRIDI